MKAFMKKTVVKNRTSITNFNGSIENNSQISNDIFNNKCIFYLIM